MAEPVRVRELDDDEGNRLLRILRPGTRSVVTWRRAQMLLMAAQGMPVPIPVHQYFPSRLWSADTGEPVSSNFTVVVALVYFCR